MKGRQREGGDVISFKYGEKGTHFLFWKTLIVFIALEVQTLVLTFGFGKVTETQPPPPFNPMSQMCVGEGVSEAIRPSTVLMEYTGTFKLTN